MLKTTRAEIERFGYVRGQGATGQIKAYTSSFYARTLSNGMFVGHEGD